MDQIPQIVPPLRGVWKAIRTPGHHRFAYDFAAAGEDRKLFSASIAKLMISKMPVRTSYGWAKPVYSPVDGEVFTASDGWPDRPNLNLPRDLIKIFVQGMFQASKVRQDLRIFAGNYVIIVSERYYVLLAHLRNGSLKIEPHQNVSRGQQIANVGNSGNSAAPHLHLQINDGSDLLASMIKKFRFTRCDRWTGNSWETIVGMSPRKGELMRFYD